MVYGYLKYPYWVIKLTFMEETEGVDLVAEMKAVSAYDLFTTKALEPETRASLLGMMKMLFIGRQVFDKAALFRDAQLQMMKDWNSQIMFWGADWFEEGRHNPRENPLLECLDGLKQAIEEYGEHTKKMQP